MLLSALATTPSAAAQAPPSAVTWERRVEIAAGEGHRGSWRGNQSDFRYVDDPSVALARDGDAVVAWVDNARKDVFLQRYSPEGRPRLSAPVNVSRSSATFSWLPRVLVARDDPRDVFILWQEIIFSGGSHGGDILFARSTDAGRTFSAPVNLSNSVAGDGKGRLSTHVWHNGSLDLARGPRGELYAAWTEYEGALWLRRSADGGATFSPPVLVVPQNRERPARAPTLAVTPDGTVHLAWAVGETSAADVQYTASRDAGRTFEPPRAVGASDGHSDAPKLAAQRDGTLHLAYAESAEGVGGQYHIRYARLRPGARDFEAPRRISEPRDRANASAHFPHLRVDDRGRVYVLWERASDQAERPQWLEFTYSTDGGERFRAASALPDIASPELGSNGSHQGMLMSKLAVGEGGAIAVVNSTIQPERSSHIWLLRGRLDQ